MLAPFLFFRRAPNPLFSKRNVPCLGILTLLLCLLLSGCLGGPGVRGDAPPHPDGVKPADAASTASSSAVRYAVRIESNPPNTGLVAEMRENSQLVWLRDEPPDSRVGLERRLLEDMETARKILHSRGYYDGRVRRRIDWDARPVTVALTLVPGEQYVVGRTSLRYERPESESATPETAAASGPGMGTDFMQNAPETLASFGLSDGAPAEAQTVLQAVASVVKTMHRQGYPLAEEGKARYVIDRSTHTLEAEVAIKTGPLLRMGSVRVHEKGVLAADGKEEPGLPSVSEDYLDMLSPWINGQYWDDELLKQYRTTLQETGLFSSIDIKPARVPLPDTATPLEVEEKEVRPINAAVTGPAPQGPLWVTEEGLTPVSLTVRDAPPRTISGGLLYSTDTGFGVRGAWENRNLWGGGEQLRITAPISQDSQSLNFSFRKPAFGIRDQALVGEAWAINETTDAYDQTALSFSGGLERRFRKNWRHWWASARVSVEAGRLDDNLNGSRTYSLVGIPLAVRRDTTNDLLNPTTGTRISLEVTPYTGTYVGPLTTVRSRLDASGYYSPFDWSRLVLAGRVGLGSLSGESVEDIPASLRFYTGGGGSVRGYKYQSLGPQDKNGDPLGGLSFTDVSFEARFKITESFGIVPFVDGGMVYESSTPDWGRDLAWGVGLGFRYYTLIGPIRLDVATPLQDRDDNKAFQIYLSIGQAF